MRGRVAKGVGCVLCIAVPLAAVRAQTSDTLSAGDPAIEVSPLTESEAEAVQRAAEEVGMDRPRSERAWRIELNHLWSTRLDTGRGYQRRQDTLQSYAGNPWRLLLDARIRLGARFAARLAAEKDPGERLRLPGRGRRTDIDFATWTVSATDVGPVRTMVAGDYSMHWAWGLLVGRPAFGILVRPMRPRRSTITSYRGLSESAYLRGAAAAVGKNGPWQLAVFASRRRIDARPDTSTAAPAGTRMLLVSSSDLHRTSTEIRHRKVLGMSAAGAFLTVGSDRITAGLGTVAVRFANEIAPGDRPDQRSGFSGFGQWGGSVYLSIRTARLNQDTEIAVVNGRVSGVVIGHEIPVVRSWTIWSYFRAVSGPTSLLGSIPRSGGTGPGQESGITFGIRLKIARSTTAWTSYDYYWFDALRFATPLPTAGRRWDLTLKYSLNRSETVLRVARTQGQEASRALDPSGIPTRTVVTRTRWRLSVLVRLNGANHGGVDIRYAGAYSGVHSIDRRAGHLLAIDLRTDSRRRVQLEGRFALFHSESSEARIYVYERGLTQEFGIPSYSGSGERWYVVMRVRPRAALLLRLKYAATRWPGESSSGSGLDEVPGDRIRSVGAELGLTL